MSDRLGRTIARLALLRGAARALSHDAPRTPPQDGSAPRGNGEREPLPEVHEREVQQHPAAELAVAGLLVLGGLAGAAFVVAFVLGANTQWLGLGLGGALAFIAAACMVAAKRVVPRETISEERPQLVHEAEEEESVRYVREAAEGVSRRRLIAAAAGVAGAGVASAAALPLTALGPSVDKRIDRTPWRSGIRLVDSHGAPLAADTLEVGSFTTAFPEGSDPRELGSPVVVVRIDPRMLRLPPRRRGWAPEGIVAFSKICTHAGCAVALFRYPTYEPTSKPPALVCPCHYSTFDVRQGGTVVFGPAVRALPQLPLVIDAQRHLVAGGPFSGTIGPSWWGAKPS
jgi:ubiquinol-cytochrome c reductase iron-sulfur subunit